jgi:Mrp family chromosome partitioning ATPase
LLENPAFLSVSDTVVLVQFAEKVLFIARRAYAHKESLQNACSQLADLKAEILGLVINGENIVNQYYTYPSLKVTKKR